MSGPRVQPDLLGQPHHDGSALYVSNPYPALGESVTVRVRVPPGTHSGQRVRLRERGVPTRTGGKGDLVVEVRLALPKVLDERSKDLLREFGRINGESVRN